MTCVDVSLHALAAAGVDVAYRLASEAPLSWVT